MKTKLIISTLVLGVILASAVTTPAFAWHPKGKITKYVQNQTTAGQMADANDLASAVNTKPGDLIKYTIVIENIAAAASQNYNDMYYTVLTDALPAGVELVSDPAKRSITETIGVITPGQKVTKEYILKVTSTKNSDVITNKACFTGDSKVNDNAQDDCNNAVITVSVPPTTPPTTPPITPETPKTLSTATTLPVTGAGSLVVPAGVIAGLGYVGNLLRLKLRNKR